MNVLLENFIFSEDFLKGKLTIISDWYLSEDVLLIPANLLYIYQELREYRAHKCIKNFFILSRAGVPKRQCYGGRGGPLRWQNFTRLLKYILKIITASFLN